MLEGSVRGVELKNIKQDPNRGERDKHTEKTTGRDDSCAKERLKVEKKV